MLMIQGGGTTQVQKVVPDEASQKELQACQFEVKKLVNKVK